MNTRRTNSFVGFGRSILNLLDALMEYDDPTPADQLESKKAPDDRDCLIVGVVSFIILFVAAVIFISWGFAALLSATS